MKVMELEEPNGVASKHNTLEVQFIFICDKTKTEIQKTYQNQSKVWKGRERERKRRGSE
jgi:hypothetical protein